MGTRYYTENIGASVVIKDRKNGEVVAFRPHQEAANKTVARLNQLEPSEELYNG